MLKRLLDCSDCLYGVPRLIFIPLLVDATTSVGCFLNVSVACVIVCCLCSVFNWIFNPLLVDATTSLGCFWNVLFGWHQGTTYKIMSSCSLAKSCSCVGKARKSQIAQLFQTLFFLGFVIWLAKEHHL